MKLASLSSKEHANHDSISFVAITKFNRSLPCVFIELLRFIDSVPLKIIDIKKSLPKNLLPMSIQVHLAKLYRSKYTSIGMLTHRRYWELEELGSSHETIEGSILG